jgi:hypothetical protein
VKCETFSLRKCLVGWDDDEITSAIAGRLAQDENCKNPNQKCNGR